MNKFKYIVVIGIVAIFCFEISANPLINFEFGGYSSHITGNSIRTHGNNLNGYHFLGNPHDLITTRFDISSVSLGDYKQVVFLSDLGTNRILMADREENYATILENHVYYPSGLNLYHFSGGMSNNGHLIVADYGLNYDQDDGKVILAHVDFNVSQHNPPIPTITHKVTVDGATYGMAAPFDVVQRQYRHGSLREVFVWVTDTYNNCLHVIEFNSQYDDSSPDAEYELESFTTYSSISDPSGTNTYQFNEPTTGCSIWDVFCSNEVR